MIRYKQVVQEVEHDFNTLGDKCMSKKKKGYSNLEEFENLLEVYELDILMNELIDRINFHSERIKYYAKNNNEFLGRANWLKEWNETAQRDTFLNILSQLSVNNLKEDKIEKLQKRVCRYIMYFGFIEDEENERKKYEDLFNFLTQIPAQINNFIKLNIENENCEFKHSIHSESLKRVSSLEDALFYDIAA